MSCPDCEKAAAEHLAANLDERLVVPLCVHQARRIALALNYARAEVRVAALRAGPADDRVRNENSAMGAWHRGEK